MATYVPPKINTAYVFYISLVSQANTKVFQANPTLAAGDFNVATDDGAPGALGTTPVVDADFTKRVKVTLAAGEMNGGNVTLICSDAAGAEGWDLTINIQTSARQADGLAFPVTSGRGLDVTATGAAGVDWANVENPTTALALTGTTIATTQKVDVETIKTNPVVNGGTVTFTTNSTVASTTNITGGVITTVTNLTNAPTNGDLTATLTAMKGATFAGATDSLEAIRDRGDAAWITATGFSTHSAADVWASVARTLTAGTNIVLAKGVGVTGFNDIAATAIVSAGAITTLSGAVANVDLVDVLTTYTSNTLQTADHTANIAAILTDTGTTLDTAITAIKTTTDKITFTAANQVDANVQSVNDVTITGNGSGTPFNV